MSRSRKLADLLDANGDVKISNLDNSTALPKAGGAMSGNITMAGSQTVDGRDLSADGSKLDGIAASANNYVHPNHSGEVTSTADGATVIADNVVDEANLKISNTPTNGFVLTAQSGNTGGLTWATSPSTNATHTGEVTGATALTIADNIVDEANLKVSNAPSNGYFLSAQSGNTGGMTWAEVDALPSQSSNGGKFLTTNGSAASWAVLDTDANTTTKGLYEMKNVISANYSITSGNNAMSAGPITINSNVSVTVPSGSTWVIA